MFKSCVIMLQTETANLDGETNLKVRKALEATSVLQDVDDLANLKAAIQCEAPNERLYRFVPPPLFSSSSSSALYTYFQKSNRNSCSSRSLLYFLFLHSPNLFSFSNRFNGRLILEGKDKQVYSLNHTMFLQRGAQLRNTKYCYGVCVYAGVDTKLFLNQQPPPSKFSTVERVLNRFVFYFHCQFLNLLFYSIRGFMIYSYFKLSAI